VRGQRHRPVRGGAVVARPQLRHPVGQLVEEGVVDRLGDVHPLDADAGLPGVGHRAPRGRVGRRVGHIAARGFGMRVIYNDVLDVALAHVSLGPGGSM